MGNVGKPPHLPAGKANTSEEWRMRQGQDSTKGPDARPMTGPDLSQAPTGEENSPILHGGQRPGARSRISEAVEENPELKEAEANYIRNRAPVDEK